MEFDKYLKAKELAATLSVKVSTIYDWHQRGVIRGIKIGKVVRFKKKDIVRFLEDRERAASRRAFRS